MRGPYKSGGGGAKAKAPVPSHIGWKTGGILCQRRGKARDHRVRSIRLTLSMFLLAAACGGAASPPPNSALSALLAERKFQPSACYTGADTPADQPALEDAVDNAIRDVAALPSPAESTAVRGRLQRLIRDVEGFATEDRDEAYRYAIRIWRAAGQRGESHLFAMRDARMLSAPC
jgi:hypothetical protein